MRLLFLNLLKTSAVQKVIFFTSLFFLLISVSGRALTLSEQTDLSILTCGPGEMIHAIYGHTAIRVKDPLQGLDMVFNYGVFSFSKPNFVYRFAKGQTDYMLAAERYRDFYENYVARERSVYEQVLDLDLADKQRLWDFLVENAKPENREYRYNFFMDNCATRVRDVIKNQLGERVEFPEEGDNKTFREHINHYQRVLPWTDFGIDLALGRPADQTATAWQEMFLPDYLMKHFGDARMKTPEGDRPLVKETHPLFEAARQPESVRILTPFNVFALALVLIVVLSVAGYRKKKSWYMIDYLWLFFTGFAGIAVLFLSQWSEHPAVRSNYNFLWAVPFNFLFLFAWTKQRWRGVLLWYWPALSLWMVLFLIFGAFLPQQFHPAAYLIAVMVLCRSLLHTFQLYGKNKQD